VGNYLFIMFRLEDFVTKLKDSQLCSAKIGRREVNIILSYDAQDLQEKIIHLENYFSENNLTINLHKSKLVFQNVVRNTITPVIFL